MTLVLRSMGCLRGKQRVEGRQQAKEYSAKADIYLTAGWKKPGHVNK